LRELFFGICCGHLLVRDGRGGGEEVEVLWDVSERGIIISGASDDLMRDWTAIAGHKIEYTKRAI
jgi:hypothetical protein